MSATDLNSLTESLARQWKPNDTKLEPKDKPGVGKAIQNVGLPTPEGTPEVDDGRIEAEKERQGRLKAAEAAKQPPRSQPPEKKDAHSATKTDDDGTDDEAAEQAETLKEVLSYRPDEHHKILGIKEDYGSVAEEKATIERAVYNRGIKVHPKYNKDPNAEKAWNMVRTAGNELGCSDSVYQEVLDIGDEDPDAPGDDSGSPMEGIEVQNLRPDKLILGLYEEATPFMDQLQQNPKSFSTRKKLELINGKIKKKNTDEEQENTDVWIIDYKKISEFYQQVRPLVDRVKENPSDQEAVEGAKEVEKDFDNYLDKNQYPGAWRFKQDLLMQEAVRSKTEEAKKRMKNDFDAKTKTMMEKGEKEKTADNGLASTEKPNDSSTAVPTVWRPGLTVKGEQIYAMQPYERTNKVTQEKCMHQCFFLIEKKGNKKGRNSMVFEDSEAIGPKATDGYLKQLPEADRFDIRTEKYTYSTTDKMDFVEIDDIAVKPGYSSKVYPAICARVKYENGTYKYHNRTVLRMIWGSARADRMIEDFYHHNELTVPWKKRAKRAVTAESVDVVESTEDTNATQAAERLGRGRTPSRSPERNRSSSVSSSASHLSEEGLKRLGGIEDRMDKFEKMFEILSTKLNKLQ